MRTLSVCLGGGGGGLWVVGLASVFFFHYLGYVYVHGLGYVCVFCLYLCLCSYFHNFRLGLCVKMSQFNFMF